MFSAFISLDELFIGEGASLKRVEVGRDSMINSSESELVKN